MKKVIYSTNNIIIKIADDSEVIEESNGIIRVGNMVCLPPVTASTIETVPDWVKEGRDSFVNEEFIQGEDDVIESETDIPTETETVSTEETEKVQ